MYYNVTVTYKHDEEVVHVAESTNLADMRRLAELICRNALPEVCTVRIDNGDGELICCWVSTLWTRGENAALQVPPDGRYLN